MTSNDKPELNNDGFGLVEMMVAVGILSGLIAGVNTVMQTGKRTWLNTDVQIQLQESLRRTMERVSREVQESGTDSLGTLQIIINDSAGVNSSDIIRFSIPVICESTGSIMDANGDVANWGAALTWGCTDSSCMDADDNCATVDYAATEYFIDASNQLIRRVVDAGNNTVRQDIFAENVTDMQASLNQDLADPDLHQRVVNLTLTVSKDTDENRTMTATNTINIYLRNRGT